MLHTNRTLLTAALLCLAAACGKNGSPSEASDPNGTGTTSNGAVGSGASADGSIGNIGGTPFKIASSAYALLNADPNGTSPTPQVAISLALSTAPDYCGAATANSDPANSRMLLLLFYNLTADNNLAMPTPGTYAPVESATGPGTYYQAIYAQLGADCRVVGAAQPIGTGTVTVLTIEGTAMTGSLDLRMGLDRIRGNFQSNDCPGFKTYMEADPATAPAPSCRQ
jgi:hypothetical protein